MGQFRSVRLVKECGPNVDSKSGRRKNCFVGDYSQERVLEPAKLSDWGGGAGSGRAGVAAGARADSPRCGACRPETDDGAVEVHGAGCADSVREGDDVQQFL